MNKLTEREQKYWKSYLNTLPKVEIHEDPFVIASYAGDKGITDGLIALYLNGKKIAASCLLAEFEAENSPLPEIGWHWMILDSKNNPRCIVKTTQVIFNKFKDVSEEIAQAEGEGDLSLDYWRKVHRKFWGPFLKDYDIENLDEAIIITEYFNLVYSK